MLHASPLDEFFSCDQASPIRHAPSFAMLFKHLRKKLVGKQYVLSSAGIGCTDAAISLWERGLRLPRPRTIRRVVPVLANLGATASDIEQLMAAWTAAYVARKAVLADRTIAQSIKLP